MGRGDTPAAAREDATYALASQVVIQISGSATDRIKTEGRVHERLVSSCVRAIDLHELSQTALCREGSHYRSTVSMPLAQFRALSQPVGLLLVCAADGCPQAAVGLRTKMLAASPHSRLLELRTAAPKGQQLREIATQHDIARVLVLELRGEYLGAVQQEHFAYGNYAAQLWSAPNDETVWAVDGRVKNGHNTKRRALAITLDQATDALAAELKARLARSPRCTLD